MVVSQCSFKLLRKYDDFPSRFTSLLASSNITAHNSASSLLSVLIVHTLPLTAFVFWLHPSPEKTSMWYHLLLGSYPGFYIPTLTLSAAFFSHFATNSLVFFTRLSLFSNKLLQNVLSFPPLQSLTL